MSLRTPLFKSPSFPPQKMTKANHGKNPKKNHCKFVSLAAMNLPLFERKTVSFGLYGLFISGASFIAAIIAALVFFSQLKEMSKQTDLLDITAEQARTDAKNSAVATAKQLGDIQAQITIAQTGTSALQGQLNEARRMADAASQQLRITDRPWVGVSGQLLIKGSIHDNAAATNFVYNLANDGKSVALGVSDGVWVAGGVANGFKLMDSDHCEQIAKSQRQAIALWRRWKKNGGPEPGRCDSKDGDINPPRNYPFRSGRTAARGARCTREGYLRTGLHYLLRPTRKCAFDSEDGLLDERVPEAERRALDCKQGNYAY